MTTPDIYALRWKLAAALLQIDPERDPLPTLGELRAAFVRESRAATVEAVKAEFGAFMPTGYTLERDGGFWTWRDAEHRGGDWNLPQAALRQAWNEYSARRCTDLQETKDLLAERMALLDRDKPGVTLIECIRGMLEETAQKPEQIGPHLSSALRLRERAEASEAKVKALETELTLAEAEIRGPAARATEALKALGWHGAGDPREWADAKRHELQRELAAEHDRQHADLAATRHEASHQAQRAFRAEQGLEIISAAYYKAGFGPSPTTAAKVAASIGTLQADLAAATKTATVRGHALNALGWDGRSDPEGWAADKAAALADMGSAMDDLRRQRDEARTAAVAVSHGEPDAADRTARNAARWLRACDLFCWSPETEPPTMIDFSRAQALLVEPLRAATGAFAAPSPARLVDIAVMRIQVGDKAMDDLATVRAGAHKLDKDSAQIIAAHRWRAADLQALLDHERHMRNEADKDLVDLTRPAWPLMQPYGAPRDPSPHGVIRQLVEMLAAACPILPTACENE
jgi:hypothetical protein